MAELLRGVFGKAASGEDESGSLLFTLELADSFITYRSRYRLEPMLPLVLDLLLIDESNPRSIAFQLAELARHIDTLPQSGAGGGRIEEQRMALSLLSSVRLADVLSLAKPEPGRRHAPTLQKLLDEQVSFLAAPFRRRSGVATSICVDKGVRVGTRTLARMSRDLRRQPPHHVHLPQAGAAIRAPRLHDAAVGPAADRAASQPADRAGPI